MEICSFPEENVIFDPPIPASAMQPEIVSLPVYQGILEEGYPITISCWKVTKQEMEEIQRTGRVWVIVLSHKIYPIYVLGNSPFIERDSETGEHKTGDGKTGDTDKDDKQPQT